MSLHSKYCFILDFFLTGKQTIVSICLSYWSFSVTLFLYPFSYCLLAPHRIRCSVGKGNHVNENISISAETKKKKDLSEPVWG